MAKKSRKIKKQNLIIIVAILIAFLILAGWIMFKQLTKENTEGNKTYCTAEQKNAQICSQYYSATCGWFDQSIKCLVYPCAQTFSNICSACADPKVEFYTTGECPK